MKLCCGWEIKTLTCADRSPWVMAWDTKQRQANLRFRSRRKSQKYKSSHYKYEYKYIITIRTNKYNMHSSCQASECCALKYSSTRDITNHKAEPQSGGLGFLSWKARIIFCLAATNGAHGHSNSWSHETIDIGHTCAAFVQYIIGIE